jgi:starch phosphorylase
MESGYLSHGDNELFRPVTESLKVSDEYMLCADYPSYIECQGQVGRTYLNRAEWMRMSVLNVARMGHFSSDRAIMEYCDAIWRISPVMI